MDIGGFSSFMNIYRIQFYRIQHRVMSNKKIAMGVCMFVITSISSHSFEMDRGDTLSIPYTVNCSHRIGRSEMLGYGHYECSTVKGIPADTSQYRMYDYQFSKDDSMLIILAKDLCGSYYCSFDTNRDGNFASEYKYHFTKEQIINGCDFIPQLISFRNGKDVFWQPVFPVLFMNGVPRKGMTVTSPHDFDGFVLMAGSGTYFYGKFVYQDKTYTLALTPPLDSYDIKSTEYCLYDTLMLNNDDLFSTNFRNVSYASVYGNNTFRVIDIDFQKQRCSLLVGEGISYL